MYKDDWNPGISNLFRVEVEEANIYNKSGYAVIVNGWLYCRTCATGVL